MKDTYIRLIACFLLPEELRRRFVHRMQKERLTLNEIDNIPLLLEGGGSITSEELIAYTLKDNELFHIAYTN